ncbi:uncharacterized protein HMPREF1541_03027 [Cyphellophora europaea CBS 101466]|uniref:Uncharacterized protein n=1 Tax=Cyphellophora europaea (strain CBS 101466) TaxID=1220924 RepID=W2RXB9_CYPE1|nr:uncharacterized protein HMPREF1541_03027 [Cyphellophora europaea CBS 101466]ETN41092.1 hypothetical protein HMPREF1541_03027 [Cyphellophora europaea CBS 101466]
MQALQPASEDGSVSPRENEVARTVLIELLAHQFCFPVRWIETQDLLLGSHNTERLVEFGPGNTLVNMAKRTIALKYAPRDTAQNISRQLLNFQQNLDKISYDQKFVTPPVIERQQDSVKKSDPSAESIKNTAPPPDPASTSTPPPPTPDSAPSPAAVEDQPVSVIEIVSTIIAVGLKKPLDGFQMSKSIKALSGGRSTLQNEIIGDLSAEFDAIPEAAEDLPLETLCSTIQSTFNGKLGKKSSSLIDKLISQKSPGTFQNAGIRKYLKQRWGLETGRQDSILLWAVTSQPDFRLKNEEEAKIFLDSVVQIYISKTGLVIGETPNSGGASGTQPAVSAEALEFLESRQKTAWEEQLGVYARLLGMDLQASEPAHAALRKRIAELESQLDDWNSEHGEFYSSGIHPLFTPLKARVYDSWWNWALQDLLALVAVATRSDAKSTEVLRLQRNLVNRSHPRLIKAVEYMASTTSDTTVRSLLQNLVAECQAFVSKGAMVYRDRVSRAPVTTVDKTGKIIYRERVRPTEAGSINDDNLLRLGRKGTNGWQYSDDLSLHLHQSLSEAINEGYCFNERNILVTGAGAGSIGCELVAKLLAAGANVVVTSSSYSPKVTRFYQSLYAEHGGRGSRLILVPFNQASVRDIQALVKYIYEKEGLGMDLDYIIPFAAISENGRNLNNIDSRSELAHRVMLTNTMRLLGEVKQQKETRGILTRPAQVILPLSPNHGSFGSDGLYAESKLGLESLFEKFNSEDWAEYLLVCGALIGWTRGTALMSDNDIVSEDIEKLGMRTFSQSEMAFNILALMSPSVLPLCTDEPLVADLSGGMGGIPNLKDVTTKIRTSITQLGEERRAIAREAIFDSPAMNIEQEPETQANLEFSFASLPDWDTEVQPLAQSLEGMVDLDRVVVVSGYAEVGPWGNSRIRWDMELHGQLSLESIIELAWTMGLIKAHSGIVDGQPFSGWLDKETGKPIADQSIKEKYEKFMLEHAGIRYMEPKKGSQLWDGQEALHEIEISKDHEPFEVSREAAFHLKKAHGEFIHATDNEETGQVRIVLRKGAKIMIPKLLDTQHTVAGQVPTGWEPSTFGIPEEVVTQVDPVVLYALVAAAEAFQCAGILDPYEFYKHLHVSDVANCVGSGFGGVTSIRKMFKGRYQDKEAANDILAESFISSGSAWINMLLLSAAGANKTPVGACATALESLDTAYDLIQAGKAKVCLVGGFDDMLKDISEEFANLKATINADEDAERGREPREMSRPATSTRKGFVESEGAGVQIVTSATVALEMGLPIYGVVALTRTAMDKAGRSIPAPGRGILGSAIQKLGKYDSPLMNAAYRKRALDHRRQQAVDMRELQLSYLEEEITSLREQDPSADVEGYRQQRINSIELDAKRDLKDALNQYGNNFWTHDSRIAPIRGALAVWGLTIDDIDVVSFHGTSTRANEKNEAAVINEQFKHLGRRKGNLVPGMFQKSITGHPKGPAGAWMLNGCLQAMHAGQIPGNRNADNIEDVLEQFEYLVFPNKSIPKPEIKAFITESFGFGQKGAMAIGVNPKYLYATMKQEDFLAYKEKLRLRERKASRNFHEGLSNNTVFQAKESPPWAASEEMKILLDPDARF